MRIVISGSEGQVGQALTLALAQQAEITVIAMNRTHLDISHRDQVMAQLDQAAPDLIINGAAYTNVDRAEIDKAQAFSTNCEAVGHLADYCAQAKIPMIHLSTDYVFDGQGHAPYDETCTPSPLNIYGASKLAGEKRLIETLNHHIIIRLSGVFSPWRHNFVKTILRLAQSRETLNIVDDQFTCPTAAQDIAQMLKQLITATRQGKQHWGYYHYCSQPPVSWYTFACAIVETAAPLYTNQKLATIHPIRSENFPQQAARPRYSVLNGEKLYKTFAIPPPHWQPSLLQTLTDLSTKVLS